MRPSLLSLLPFTLARLFTLYALAKLPVLAYLVYSRSLAYRVPPARASLAMAHLVPASSHSPSLHPPSPQNDRSGQATPTQESLTPTRPTTEPSERKFERSASAPAPWSPSPPSPTPTGRAQASLSFASPRFVHSDTSTPAIHAHTSEKGTFSFTVPATPPYSPAHSRESTVSTFGNDADPVSALRGRNTPFFMVSTGGGSEEQGSSDEGGKDGPTAAAWENTLGAWTRGECIDRSKNDPGSSKRSFKRGESAPAISFGEHGAAGPPGQAVRPFAHIKHGSDFAHEVRVPSTLCMRLLEAHRRSDFGLGRSTSPISLRSFILSTLASRPSPAFPTTSTVALFCSKT